MKPPLRTKSVGTKVSEVEFALLEERARGAGMRLAEWVREALLAAPVEPGGSSGVDSGEVALGEILALRSLLLNLHFRAAKGEPVVEAEMRGLIDRADGTKIERAGAHGGGSSGDKSDRAGAGDGGRDGTGGGLRWRSGTEGILEEWPSRTPVWTWMAILLTPMFFAAMLTMEYERSWTAAERLYLTDYLKSGARGKTSATAASKCTLLEAVAGPGQKQGQRLVIGDEIEEVPAMDGRPGWRLTWVTGTFNDRGLHRVMSEAVYSNIGGWEFYQKAVWLTAAFFVLALFVAVPKDLARRMLYKHGRRLRGPELVTTAEFNEKLGKSKGMRVHLPDGVAFINEEQTWWDKTFHKSLSRWARIPRDREATHFLIVGDSGTGKSAAIRQLLSQVWERGPNATAMKGEPHAARDCPIFPEP